MGFYCSSQVNQGIKYQILVAQTRNSLQLWARFHFLGSKIDFSKWHDTIATNKAAVASHGTSIPLLACENCISQPDESYLH